MHGWLPTGHARPYITEISACPEFNHHDETIDHMLKCLHPFLQRKREEMIVAFQKKRLSKKIPRKIIKQFCKMWSGRNYRLECTPRTILMCTSYVHPYISCRERYEEIEAFVLPATFLKPPPVLELFNWYINNACPTKRILIQFNLRSHDIATTVHTIPDFLIEATKATEQFG